MRVKRRIFSGAVLEQEVFTVPDTTRDIKNAEYRPRFADEGERAGHREAISRRNFERKVNANFGPHSLYSTLTMSNDYEVHTFDDARRMLNNFIRRLQYVCPEMQAVAVMGRGKGTNRIHFHLITNGVTRAQIAAKWVAGDVVRIENLRAHNIYNGVDHGRDYTGLARYLFDHWTPEQGGHRWKQTKNLKTPEREAAAAVNRNYTVSKPPRAPKGYRLVDARENAFGYLWFLYVKNCDEGDVADAGKRMNKAGRAGARPLQGRGT